jgi:predicted dehydrogenase
MSDQNNIKKASVLLVGCGAPLKSMGAYHALQILDGRVPDAELEYVVEPWFFNEASKSAPGYEEFHAWRKTLETERGVKFFSTVADVPPSKEGDLRLAIISARTSDNPALLKACVANGCKAIYLEKPGATTVEDLEAMRDLAVANGVAVHMGFNKNVSGYLTKSREFAKNHGDDPSKTNVTFLHNNNYPDTTEALSECFERNAEGMLKNMAIHELAICVTYYGVTVDTINSVTADREYSSLRTLGNFTDFDKLKFTIITTAGVSISVAADRCGGDDSVGIVTDAASGAELARFSMPDAATVAKIPALREHYGDAMPYFFAQDPDYLELKNRVVQSVVHGTHPDGVASIDVAVETLRVAEYLTPILQEQLK